MANDHFISQFLTKRWESPPGRTLNYYDFGAGEFLSNDSETLFAYDGLHTAETGAALNRLVEQPVAQHLRLLERDAKADLVDPGKWSSFRAFAALWWLNPQRLSDANTPGELAFTLDQLMQNGEAVVDTIGQLAQKHFQLLVVTTQEELFFTEVGAFPIPLMGALLLALPLSPHHFMTLVPNSVTEPERELRAITAPTGLLSGLSIGVGSRVRKVILPPKWVPQHEANMQRVRSGMTLTRETARQFIETIGRARTVIGLSPWTVT